MISATEYNLPNLPYNIEELDIINNIPENFPEIKSTDIPNNIETIEKIDFELKNLPQYCYSLL